MNKFMMMLSVALLSNSSVMVFARGGDVAAGLVGGLAVGTLVGTAAANSGNRRADRVEEKLDRMKMQREQDEKVEQVRREMQQQREMERRLMEQEQTRLHGQTFGNSSAGSMMYLLFGLIFLLLIGVVGLAVVVFRGKNNNKPF